MFEPVNLWNLPRSSISSGARATARVKEGQKKPAPASAFIRRDKCVLSSSPITMNASDDELSTKLLDHNNDGRQSSPRQHVNFDLSSTSSSSKGFHGKRVNSINSNAGSSTKTFYGRRVRSNPIRRSSFRDIDLKIMEKNSPELIFKTEMEVIDELTCPILKLDGINEKEDTLTSYSESEDFFTDHEEEVSEYFKKWEDSERDETSHDMSKSRFYNRRCTISKQPRKIGAENYSFATVVFTGNHNVR